MTALRLVAIAFMLTTAHAQAQSPGEIAFWESVRESRNPAELQAYIDQFPNGTFVVLAKSRLAALQRSAPAAAPARAPQQRVEPPPQASVASQSFAAGMRSPQAGDTWIYRLSYPRLRGQWGQAAQPPRTHSITVVQASDSEIIDQVSVDSGTPISTRFTKGSFLTTQGVSIYSPYLAIFEDLSAPKRLGRVEILDLPCLSEYACEASARVLGPESVTVPAGQFSAIKVLVEQAWRPAQATGSGVFQSGQLTGGRTLTVWYVPEIKRAVRFASRVTVGAIPPVDANFDLELMSYQLK